VKNNNVGITYKYKLLQNKAEIVSELAKCNKTG